MTTRPGTGDRESWWRSGYAVVGVLAAVAMVGFGVGHLVMHLGSGANATSRAYAELPEFTIHAGVVASQVALWFAAVPALVWRQRTLLARFDLRASWKSVVVGVAGLLAVLVVPFTLNRPGEEYPLAHADWRTNLLYVLGAPLIIAAVLVLDAVDRASRRSGWSEPDEAGHWWDADDLAALRGAARGVLAVLGIAVSGVVFATGAQFNAIDAYLESGGEGTSPSQALLLVYGALFVVALGVLYAPAHRALADAGDRLVARSVPLPADDRDGAQLADVLATRAALRDGLGIDTDLRSSLEQAVVIVSPLLSGVVTLFLTGRS